MTVTITEKGTESFAKWAESIRNNFINIGKWINDHEELTLPRFEKELIELIKTSEPLREEIRSLLNIKSIELTTNLKMEAEQELDRAIESVLSDPSGHISYEDFKRLHLAHGKWKEKNK